MNMPSGIWERIVRMEELQLLNCSVVNNAIPGSESDVGAKKIELRISIVNCQVRIEDLNSAKR